MVWRFRASTEGLCQIKLACKQKGWTRDTFNKDDALVKASRILEPDKIWPKEGLNGRIYASGINEASWRRFLLGQASISAQVFSAYCQSLDVSWENIVDWNEINSPIPFIHLPNNTDSRREETESGVSQPQHDISQFIRDVSIPDGTIMNPNEKFRKEWEIRNSGNVVWQNRYLKRLGACTGPALISSSKRVKVPKTKPGENVILAVNLKAPEVATTTTALWKMTFKDGTLCYPDRYKYGLAVVIQVLQ